MSIKKTNRKKNQKKQKPRASKTFTQKARLTAKIKPKAKSKAAKSKPAKNKVSHKKKTVRATAAVRRKNQSVETVSLEPKGLGTRAGVGAGDLQGISILENVDSESAEELLEEGQAFEAGIISGVEDAPDADKSEVTTHEVPQDDVPGEYDDKDRP
ncbi:MAG TPA: hypothetical protein VOA64_14680 [Candidatus Dormibacteraeota bacterium]|nr:hypothetical protein [Candidatus Dormibacteraeota bacterium]